MIYLDSSVALARVFVEPRSVPDSFWNERLVSSRLLEYEVWTRIHARGLTRFSDAVRELLGRIDLIELDSQSLGRALEPFPVVVRTLDALHLASIEFLRDRRIEVALASFDNRMLLAAQALQIPIYQY